MGYGTEVKATLGVDSESIPKDLSKAREAFGNSLRELEQDAQKHGAGAGDKLTAALEHRIFGARHLSTALATALGLNLEKISEHIAGAIAGGTAEGWKRAIEISDRNAELIEKIIESKLTPKQLEEKHQKDLARAIEEANKKPGEDSAIRGILSTLIGGPLGGRKFGSDLLASFGWGKTDAEKLTEEQERQRKILEAQSAVEQDKAKTRKELKTLADQEFDAMEKTGTLEDRQATVSAHIAVIYAQLRDTGLTEVEIARKKVELQAKENELAELNRQIKEKGLEDGKKDLEISAKKSALVKEQFKLEHDQAKLTDRTKLSLGELASLRPIQKSQLEKALAESSQHFDEALAFGENVGLTDEQIQGRKKAREIQRLEGLAEQARLAGDQPLAAELIGRIGSMREELVKGGLTKSTEGDPARQLLEVVREDNDTIIKTLAEISTTEKGKYVNQ